MRQAHLRCLAIIALLVLRSPLPALAAESKGLVWDLVTVGPDSDLFALFGHSALCVSSGELQRGDCYDFGVAREHDPTKLSVGTLRGERLFGVVKLPARVLLASYQLRDTFQQRLDVPQESAASLLAELEAATSQRKTYAYQPLYRNCTTELRDRLDGALGGRLARNSTVRSGVPLRQLAEAGLTGRVLPLALLELARGTRLDRPSTSWERMGLPNGLMQEVEARLGATPTRLFSRLEAAPPKTSPSAGRIVLVVTSALACLLIWLLARRVPARARLGEAALGLGLVALSLPTLVGALSTLPCLEHNWLLFALVPTDALLCLPLGSWQRHYVTLRLGSLLLLAGAAAIGLIGQSIWTGLWLAAMPLGLWRSLRARQPV